MDTEISSAFPFYSRFCKVKQSKIHYIDEGVGPTLLFLHDIPLSNYLWRNIIPGMKDVGRCIAPDFVGMGKSEKPRIHYSTEAHIEFMQLFIEQLDLNDITLVMHGWGSVVGFALVQRNPEKIRGLAFMESYLQPMLDLQNKAFLLQELGTELKQGVYAKDKVIHNNVMIEKLLQQTMLRRLSQDELDAYRQPFETEASRLMLWDFIEELPVDNKPDYIVNLIKEYTDWLKTSSIPKLMLYALPGLLTPMTVVKWCKDNLPELSLGDVGDGLHYGQEDNPALYTKTLKNWFTGLPAEKGEGSAVSSVL